MANLTTILNEVIKANPTIQVGLSNKLFNLSQLARFLLPTIQAKSDRDISQAALLMALSRYQRSINSSDLSESQITYSFKNIQVTSNLSIFSYAYTPDRRREVITLAKEIEAKGRPLSFTHGLGQITLFVQNDDVSRVRARLNGKPLQVNTNIALVGALFSEDECKKPGFFHAVFQQLYLQKINVIEVASTMTELLIYIDETDLRLAFDTLYNRFIRDI